MFHWNNSANKHSLKKSIIHESNIMILHVIYYVFNSLRTHFHNYIPPYTLSGTRVISLDDSSLGSHNLIRSLTVPITTLRKCVGRLSCDWCAPTSPITPSNTRPCYFHYFNQAGMYADRCFNSTRHCEAIKHGRKQDFRWPETIFLKSRKATRSLRDLI